MKRHSIRIGLAMAACAALALAATACGGDSDDGDDDAGTSSTATQANAGGIPSNLTKVAVSDNKFTPLNLQVPAGANVTWEWTGSNPHQVSGTFVGQEVLSPRLTGTGVFLFNFPKAGVFDYRCTIHGDAMKGTITVR